MKNNTQPVVQTTTSTNEIKKKHTGATSLTAPSSVTGQPHCPIMAASKAASTDDNEWDWIDSSEVIQLLKISYNTLMRLTRSGILPKSKLGHRNYYRRSIIIKILNSNMITEDGHIDRYV